MRARTCKAGQRRAKCGNAHDACATCNCKVALNIEIRVVRVQLCNCKCTVLSSPFCRRAKSHHWSCLRGEVGGSERLQYWGGLRLNSTKPTRALFCLTYVALPSRQFARSHPKRGMLRGETIPPRRRSRLGRGPLLLSRRLPQLPSRSRSEFGLAESAPFGQTFLADFPMGVR